MRRRGNPMYGNENGLPGLPKTTYVTVGGRRVQPQPPRTQMRRPPPPPPPIRTNRPPPLLTPRSLLPPQPSPSPIIIPSGPDPTLSRRIDGLELRINSTEQSNRTLLDELMRLQQDIKANVRKNEMAIQEERDSRSRLEMTIRQSQSRNQEVDDRIRRSEDRDKDNQGAIQQLSGHVQNIENLVSSIQQEQIEKKGESSNKLQEYRREVTRLTQENEHLTRIVTNMRAKSEDSESRIDNLHTEIVTLQNNLRLQSRLLQDNANKTPPKTPGVDKRILDMERENTDSQITHLNTAIQELSSRVTSEAGKREKTEQDFKNKLNKMLSELNVRKSESENNQKEYDEKMKAMQLGFSETDKQQIRMEISRNINDLNKKIDANDTKVRDETVNKLTVIQETLVKENQKREDKEKELEKKIEKGMQELKEKGEKDGEFLQTALNTRVVEHKEKLSALNKRMNDVEAVVRDHKLEQEKVLDAEITERLKSDKILDAKIDDLEDDCLLGFKTVQDELGQRKQSPKDSKAPPPPSVNVDEIIEMQERKANGIREQLQREIGELESRVSSLETEAKQREDMLENRIQTAKAEDQEANTLMGNEIQQQIDALVFKHGKLKKKVDDLEHDVSATPKNLQTFKEDTNDTISQLKKEINKEEKERKNDVEELKDGVRRVVGSNNDTNVPSLAQLQVDMDQTQTGLKKCAESIHVVKVMLGDKVKDERKIREKQFAIFETDIERLDTKIKELKERIKNTSGNDDTITDLDDLI